MTLRQWVWAVACSMSFCATTHAAVDWDAVVRAQLAAPSTPATSLAFTVTQPTRLPRRDVTTALLAARAHWGELSAQTQRVVSAYLQRPYPAGAVIDEPGFSEVDWAFGNVTETTIVSSGGHFKIHYIDKDDYPNNLKASTDAHAAQVADVLENVYATEHGTLGYLAVPSDSDANFNGGDGGFDVYLTELGEAGLYGYVANEGLGGETGRPYGEYSYMVLDNDYSTSRYGYADPMQPLQVTAAHEYFHAIQFGYSGQETVTGFAFMEASATWMEDVVYPTVHDNYAYLGEPYTDSDGDGQYDSPDLYTDSNENGRYDVGESFEDVDEDGEYYSGEPYTDRNGDGTRDEGSTEYPEASLDAFNDIPQIHYGRFVWFKYLAQNHGVGIVKTIFEKCGEVAGDNMLGAIDESLQGFGATLASAYREYATWNYDLSKYDDGANYPLVYVERTESGDNYQFTSEGSPSLDYWGTRGYLPQMHLSTIYYQILNPIGTATFASSGGVAALTMLVDLGSGDLDAQVVPLTNGDGSWTAPDGAIKAIAVISNVSPTADRMQWSMTGSGYTPPASKSVKKKSFFGAIGVAELSAIAVLGMFARRRRAPRASQTL